MFHICLELTWKYLKPKERSASRVYCPIPLTRNYLEQSLVPLSLCSPRAQGLCGPLVSFSNLLQRLEWGLYWLMYSEEAEFNTKTMYMCSFDISVLSAYVASGDPDCFHKSVCKMNC